MDTYTKLGIETGPGRVRDASLVLHHIPSAGPRRMRLEMTIDGDELRFSFDWTGPTPTDAEILARLQAYVARLKVGE